MRTRSALRMYAIGSLSSQRAPATRGTSRRRCSQGLRRRARRSGIRLFCFAHILVGEPGSTSPEYALDGDASMKKPAATRKSKTRSRAAARKSPARRAVAPATKARSKARSKVRSKVRSKAKRPRRQTFVASHFDESDFEQGLRRYAKYRDLGIAAATNGLAQAHVIRMVPPCDPAEVSKRHYHDVDFQMIYVLKGWIKGEYEGAGVVTMREGSCWLQPPRIKHTVLDYSDDCELLEIVLPADFKTVELE